VLKWCQVVKYGVFRVYFVCETAPVELKVDEYKPLPVAPPPPPPPRPGCPRPGCRGTRRRAPAPPACRPIRAEPQPPPRARHKLLKTSGSRYGNITCEYHPLRNIHVSVRSATILPRVNIACYNRTNHVSVSPAVIHPRVSTVPTGVAWVQMR
jgi:hypothetical protein